MTHLKRHAVPKNWPIERKGTAYVARSIQGTSKGVPILIALRDMLKVAKDRREVKKILHSKQLLLNNKIARDERNLVGLLDILTLIPMEKFYRMEIASNGKFALNEIKKNEADKKVAKLINKTVLKGKKNQLNLSDGRNLLSDMGCKVNDSLVIDLKEGKINKCLALKEGAEVLVFAGKHSGKKGKIEKINQEKKIAEIISEKEKINVLIKQMIVIN